MHRRFCSRLLLAAALLPASAALLARTPPDTVRIGSTGTIADAAFYLAIDRGLFKAQGINAELRDLTNSTMAITSLASGDLDVSGGSAGGGVANAVRQGIEIRLVADKGSARPGHGYMGVVVRKELASAVRNATDLRGRTVALTGFGSGAASEVMMSHLLREGALTEKDVRFINISFADIMAGLGTGKVDAGVLVEPLITQAVSQGLATVWKRADAINPGQQFTAVFYGPGIIKRPDVANRFMVAYLQGARLYNEALAARGSPAWEELVTTLTRHTRVKDRALYEQMVFPGLDPDGRLNQDGMKRDMAWFVSAGRMKEAIDVNRMIDTRYVDAALARLGAARR